MDEVEHYMNLVRMQRGVYIHARWRAGRAILGQLSALRDQQPEVFAFDGSLYPLRQKVHEFVQMDRLASAYELLRILESSSPEELLKEEEQDLVARAILQAEHNPSFSKRADNLDDCMQNVVRIKSVYFASRRKTAEAIRRAVGELEQDPKAHHLALSPYKERIHKGLRRHSGLAVAYELLRILQSVPPEEVCQMNYRRELRKAERRAQKHNKYRRNPPFVIKKHK
jgi:hypothetical protein